ncbi:unnamed protein product [Brachionus calyciflorus]|uniref:Chitin-binding type-2 domain-containing protein n=1 Tax=Brachionus calyciflorus TaxID=104777 RepID=A0A813V7I1_9BILA|nr:unnamed protein product [Brachionus calyciflorus]
MIKTTFVFLQLLSIGWLIQATLLVKSYQPPPHNNQYGMYETPKPTTKTYATYGQVHKKEQPYLAYPSQQPVYKNEAPAKYVQQPYDHKPSQVYTKAPVYQKTNVYVQHKDNYPIHPYMKNEYQQVHHEKYQKVYTHGKEYPKEQMKYKEQYPKEHMNVPYHNQYAKKDHHQMYKTDSHPYMKSEYKPVYTKAPVYQKTNKYVQPYANNEHKQVHYQNTNQYVSPHENYPNQPYMNKEHMQVYNKPPVYTPPKEKYQVKPMYHEKEHNVYVQPKEYQKVDMKKDHMNILYKEQYPKEHMKMNEYKSEHPKEYKQVYEQQKKYPVVNDKKSEEMNVYKANVYEIKEKQQDYKQPEYHGKKDMYQHEQYKTPEMKYQEVKPYVQPKKDSMYQVYPKEEYKAQQAYDQNAYKPMSPVYVKKDMVQYNQVYQTASKCYSSEMKSVPNDCSKFEMCSNGIVTIMTCPNNLVFDDKMKICNYSHNVYGRCGSKQAQYGY